jgi:hypothetical protein
VANENITNALDALKTALAGIDPTPQPRPHNVYVYPGDYGSMDYNDLPFIVVAQRVNQRFSFGPVTHGVGHHRWQAEIMVMLAKGPLTRMSDGATAEAKQVSWLFALSKILFDNQGLDGNALALGDAERLFDYQIGHLELDTRVFWGLHVQVPVLQEHSLPT